MLLEINMKKRTDTTHQNVSTHYNEGQFDSNSGSKASDYSIKSKQYLATIAVISVMCTTLYPQVAEAEVCWWYNTYCGDEGDNDLIGGNIPSYIYGYGGNDRLNGRGSSDELYGGAGNDKLYGGAGNDFLYGNSGDDTLDGGTGVDLLDGGSGNDTATFRDTYGDIIAFTSGVGIGGSGFAINSDSGYGFGGHIFAMLIGIENLTGSIFNDTLTGDAGNNILNGGLGHNILDGGAGSDTASYEGGDRGVTVNLNISGEQKTYNTKAGYDTLISIENLTGSNGNDTLIGNDGKNILRGGPGNDTLIGGWGSDTASYEGAAGGVTVNLNISGPQDTLGWGELTSAGQGYGQGFDTLSGIENLIGSDHDDTLTGDSGYNTLDGGAGNDTLIGGAGVNFLIGGEGIDTASYAGSASGVDANLLTSRGFGFGTGQDTYYEIENLTGSDHNDTLIGDGNNNTLNGGKGNDILMGGAGDDILEGGEGIDTASYKDTENYGFGVIVDLGKSGTWQGTLSAGTDKLSGIENLTGSKYNDFLVGDGNDNILNGGKGNDSLWGQGGQDTASYDDAESRVTVDLRIVSGYQNTSGAGQDSLLGIENLTGSNYNDILIGDGNNNTLSGGAGDDTLYGYAGNDTFVWDNTVKNADVIHDTSGNDTLRYTNDVDIAGIVIKAKGQNDLLISLGANNTTFIANQYGAADKAIENFGSDSGAQNFNVDMSFEQLVGSGQFNQYAIEGTFTTAENITNVNNLQVTGQLANNHTLTNQGTVVVNYGGKINNAIGTVNSKVGSNITFNGSSTLDGVVVNNGLITVADNQVLTLTGDISGSGTFAGSTFFDGATVNPGNSPGTLTLAGNTTWDNIDLTIEIANAVGGGFIHDTVDIFGDLMLLSKISLNFDFLGGLDVSSLLGKSFNYLNVSGGVFDSTGTAIDMNEWLNIYMDGWGTTWTQQSVDNQSFWQLALTYNASGQNGSTGSPVPEPSTWLLMLFGVGVLSYRLKKHPQLESRV
jgi:Ca2+-binding RTX toxin-like protein